MIIPYKYIEMKHIEMVVMMSLVEDYHTESSEPQLLARSTQSTLPTATHNNCKAAVDPF